MKLFAFRIVLAAMVLLPILLGDYLLGIYRDTAVIREEARKFRAEADYLWLTTKNIVPNSSHQYTPSDRGSSYAQLGESARFFRSDELGTIIGTPPSSTAKHTILFLGGSTTESNEVDETFRFPALVQSKLSLLGLDVNAINGGVRGHTTQDAINSLINRFNFRNADSIVLMENINDRLLLEIRGSYNAILGTSPPTSQRSVSNSLSGLIGSVWDYASYRSNILFQIRNLGGRFDAWTGEQVGTHVTEDNINVGGVPNVEIQRQYAENITLFVAIVRALRKEPILMTQALGVESTPQDTFNDITRRVADELDVPLIDIATALGRAPTWAFLSDNIHLNNEGSQAVASIIVDVLAPRFDATPPRYSPPDSLKLSELSTICQDKPEPNEGYHSYRLQIGSGRYPSLSPDGSWLGFHRWNDGRETIHVLRLQDGLVVDVTPSGEELNERHPAFLASRSNSFSLVFGSRKALGGEDAPEGLVVYEWPSERRTAIELPESLAAAIPQVHKRTVYFAGFPTDRSSFPAIYAYDLDRGSLSQITDAQSEHWRPAPSTDGRIFFIKNDNGQFDIHFVNLPDLIPELFYGTPADEWDPAVSPDGQWLAFASKATGQWEVYIQEIRGAGEPIQITQGPGEKWDPAWDPSGNLLLYAAHIWDETSIFATCPFRKMRDADLTEPSTSTPNTDDFRDPAR